MKVCSRYFSGTKGIYAKAIPEYKTSNKLEKLIRDSGPPFGTGWFENKLHISLMCSDVAPEHLNLQFPTVPIQTNLVKADYWEGANGKGFAIFHIHGKPFHNLHTSLQNVGAVHKYGKYIPHITAGLEIGPSTEELHIWLHRINSMLLYHRYPLYFNRIKIRDNVI
jgi:hypothetical protein